MYQSVTLRQARLVPGRVTVYIGLQPAPPRPTQPPILSGTRNKYRPKCGDAPQLRNKGRVAHSICGSTYELCQPECYRGKYRTHIIKHCTNVLSIQHNQDISEMFWTGSHSAAVLKTAVGVVTWSACSRAMWQRLTHSASELR